MIGFRIIPSLLLSDRGLVKTEKFCNPKYVGDPINAIRIFNEKEVDELFVTDIEASVKGRGPDFEFIEQLASECFMPMGYGGGIKTYDQAKQLFDIGIEKVALQSTLATNRALVGQIAARYGSQAVVASVDVKKDWLGRRKPYSRAGAKFADASWQDMVKSVVGAGAGEVLLNAVDRDGTRGGMDLELIEEAASLVDVPVTAIGGAGSLDDFEAARGAGASAVAAGAFFVFQGPHKAVLISYPRPRELKELWRKQ
ncbi:AglZ/HisF2 family acetamidino modification protein [Ancylobacter sp. TS-1]|uniref:AglZ/HisF2 family acetamidino modification protein n=1 Tax=Ancylobacter sp. TS-1 TaxID=1850374 RepID=UPI001265BD9F|nr:AglZ/HisF2 family acetamidino modification protein [Ancylobacter sp. TS-1]QFR33434.1 imidazole glycerol phosphate synthase subunit HisF [Ancylobacter sp. TS-1]